MRMIKLVSFLLGVAVSANVLSIEVGGSVPSVSIKALSNIESKEIDLSSFEGKVVYIDFWASWCGPCKKSFPELDKLYIKHQDNGFELIAVNLDELVSDANNFLKNYPVSFPIGTDPDGISAEKFSIKGMPSGYLLDKKGVVRHIVVGFSDGEGAHLDQLISQLVAE